MSGAPDLGGVDDHVDANIAPRDPCDLHQKLTGDTLARHFAWQEEQCTERHRRRLRSSRTSFVLAWSTGLLAYLLLAQPFWPFGRASGSWEARSPMAYAMTVTAATLPSLDRAIGLTADASRANGRQSDNQDEATPSKLREHAGARNITQEASRSGESANAGGKGNSGSRAGNIQTLVRPQGTLPPQLLQQDTTAHNPSITESLIPLPEFPEAEALDRPPRLDTGSLHLDYPEAAKSRQIEGLVILHLYVDATGRTSSIRVLKSLHPSCDGAAIAALYAARFAPGENQGRPVGTYTRLMVRFVLR